MALKFTARVIFDDKKKDPIDLITDENNSVVREKIEDLFRSGCVKQTFFSDEIPSVHLEKGYRCVKEKYYGLEEIDHIELIEEFIPDNDQNDKT
jgi:hypothetical protein